MAHPLAVVLLDGERFAPQLAATLKTPVWAVTADTVTAQVNELAADGQHIVGLSAWPWPQHHQVHATLASTVAAYRGVVSWHGLPGLARALADGLKGAAQNGAHVLFTSPDPGPDVPADTLMFLPHIAEAVTALLALPGRSIAWRGDSRQPSSKAAVTALIDAHNATRIVECPVVPGIAGDDVLRAFADERGITYTATDLGVATRIGLLQQVIQTVADAEWPSD